MGVRVLDARLRRHEELQLDSEADEAVCDQLEEHFSIGPEDARYGLVELELALLNPGSLDWALLPDREHAGYSKYELEDIAMVLKMIPISDSLPPLIVHHRADIDDWASWTGITVGAA